LLRDRRKALRIDHHGRATELDLAVVDDDGLVVGPARWAAR
jgi:hypothetical protein